MRYFELERTHGQWRYLFCTVNVLSVPAWTHCNQWWPGSKISHRGGFGAVSAPNLRGKPGWAGLYYEDSISSFSYHNSNAASHIPLRVKLWIWLTYSNFIFRSKNSFMMSKSKLKKHFEMERERYVVKMWFLFIRLSKNKNISDWKNPECCWSYYWSSSSRLCLWLIGWGRWIA